MPDGMGVSETCIGVPRKFGGISSWLQLHCSNFHIEAGIGKMERGRAGTEFREGGRVRERKARREREGKRKREGEEERKRE